MADTGDEAHTPSWVEAEGILNANCSNPGSPSLWLKLVRQANGLGYEDPQQAVHDALQVIVVDVQWPRDPRQLEIAVSKQLYTTITSPSADQPPESNSTGENKFRLQIDKKPSLFSPRNEFKQR